MLFSLAVPSRSDRAQEEDAAGPSALAQATLKKKVSVCAISICFNVQRAPETGCLRTAFDRFRKRSYCVWETVERKE